MKGVKPGTPRYLLCGWSYYPTVGPFFWYFDVKRVARATAGTLRSCRRWELWDLTTNQRIDGHGIHTPSEPTAAARLRITALIARRERDVRKGRLA